ncbi:MerR family transcriptional regulator [Peribacillus glennii]|uniref:MerR family DNA-binding transcriptional regulator n=1 Tax=Peribacillus glennii TaxID=2303991 RepID=A0A372LBM6_9BACI|nr:MerR family DNA-binding transcriptional regulator [Peribacillus glennii]RFU62977.1 MerR family DNA-binding transcriptional regulator [Peribacillus glennii]
MYTISELAKEFNLTTRTIRYYEELGLINPKRSESGNRIYTRKHHAQLKLVLRGKRFGFSLDEIKEMVLLFDKDRTGEKQLQRTIEYGNQKLGEVNQRIKELNEIKAEIEELLADFTMKLDSIRSVKK